MTNEKTYAAQPLKFNRPADSQAAKEREALKDVPLGTVMEANEDFAVYCIAQF